MSTILTNDLRGGVGCAFNRATRQLVVAEYAGALVVVDEHGRRVIGEGYDRLEDVVLTADGRTAIVSERGGTVLMVDLRDADRASARVVSSGLGAPHQMALDQRRGAVLVVEFGPRGRLLRLPLPRPFGTGLRPQAITDELSNAVGLVVDAAGTTAYVSEQTGAGGRIRGFSTSTGRPRTVATGFVAPFMMAWSDAAETALLVAEREPANRVSEVSTRARLWPRRTIVEDVAVRPSSVARHGNDLYVVSETAVSVYDLTPVPALQVAFDLDPSPLFVGSWRRVGVSISGTGGGFDDLEFVVVEGPAGGRVSPSRDVSFDDAAPHIMLLAGYEPGTWTLEARHRVTGVVLAAAEFHTTTAWVGNDGPSQWTDGITQSAVQGSTWGGGQPGPQNVGINKPDHDRKVALLLVDTASRRYGSTASAVAAEWEAETFDGVTVGGKTTSVHHWFKEVSRGEFGLEKIGVFGPVSLDGEFEDYFELSGTSWIHRSTFAQAAVTAADGLVDFGTVESLVCIVRTAPPADPSSTNPEKHTDRMAWPYASGGTFTTADGSVNMATVVMPHDWEAHLTRELYETLTHELCHNLGLGDLYMDASYGAVAGRDVGGWDLMSRENPWSHPTADHKLRLGWMDAGWVRTFDFQDSGAVDEPVTLRASEAGPPQAGEHSAIEVRIGDGHNYYFEYRAEQPEQIGSQQLQPDRRVLGTDVMSPSYVVPVKRRPILLLPKDADGDGPVLGAGQDFKQLDATTPGLPNDFSLDVLSITGDTAEVRVRYGVDAKPDPSIQPWPGTGTNAWQSPDIEVRNDRNAADPTLANVPWTGHLNQIVAKVTNRGTLPASDVEVRFGVKNLTGGGGPETDLGPVFIDIPAGDTVEAVYDGWVPPPGNHYCVTVRMPLHVEPGPPTVVEKTELNNEAQSNYTEFISASASPPARSRTFVTVGNPYPERTRVFVQPRQTNPFYRTYVGASMVVLEPGEERAIEFMTEALRGTDAADEVMALHPEIEDMVGQPNAVNLAALIEDPLDPQVHVALPMGGVVATVRTGVATRIEGAGADGDGVFGQVLAADGSSVHGGTVIVSARQPGDPTSERTATGTVEDGHFGVTFNEIVQGAGLEIRAEYLGTGEWARSPETPVQG